MGTPALLWTLYRSDQKWLKLLPSYRQFQRLGDPAEIRDHGGGFADGVILSEGNEVNVLPGEELPDVFRRACQRVVGGHGDHHRAPIAQVAF